MFLVDQQSRIIFDPYRNRQKHILKGKHSGLGGLVVSLQKRPKRRLLLSTLGERKKYIFWLTCLLGGRAILLEKECFVIVTSYRDAHGKDGYNIDAILIISLSAESTFVPIRICKLVQLLKYLNKV